jgi:hypothetical protein
VCFVVLYDLLFRYTVADMVIIVTVNLACFRLVRYQEIC